MSMMYPGAAEDGVMMVAWRPWKMANSRRRNKPHDGRRAKLWEANPSTLQGLKRGCESGALLAQQQHTRLEDVLGIDVQALVVAHGDGGGGGQHDAAVLVLQGEAADAAVEGLVGLGREARARVAPEVLEGQARLEQPDGQLPGRRRDGEEVEEGLVGDVARRALGQERRHHGLEELVVLRQLEVLEARGVLALGHLLDELGAPVDEDLPLGRLGGCCGEISG